jgi:hypothetical protein
MSNKSIVFSNFNKIYFIFLDFIKKHMNNDSKFNTFYLKNKILKQTNVKLIIKTWQNRITRVYYNQIVNRDLDFFLNKSYNEDIISNTTGESNETILYYISNFKSIYPTLESSIQNSFVDYIVQLTELSFLYFKE